MSRSPAVILYDASGNQIDLGNALPVACNFRSSFSPDPDSVTTGVKGDLLQDSSGSLQTRGPVHTDEGSFLDHFPGSSLATALTGTVTFTNGSDIVTGVGTAFLSEVNVRHHVKRDADSETAWTRISEVLSDTELVLGDVYTGASGSSASSSSLWMTVTASGGSITVASGAVSLVNGNANGAHTILHRFVDYGPLFVQYMVSCSTRVTNQDAYVGLVDDATNPNERIRVIFTSTLGNTQVTFQTALDSTNLENTVVTLPNGGVTTAYHRYTITQTSQSVTLHIDGVVVAQHTLYVPGAYTGMYIDAAIQNNAALGSSTTLSFHSVNINNANRVEVTNSFSGAPLYAQIVGNNSQGLPLPVGVGSTGGLFVQPAELPTFAVNADDVVLGNNKSLLSLHLDGASTKVVKLREIYIRNSQTSAVTGVVAAFDLRRFTSHSAGTALTPGARDTNDALPSEVTARSGGTIVGAGSRLTRWEWSTDDWGAGTLDVEAYQVGVQNVTPAFSKKDPALKPWVLRPGQGMDLICATNTTAGSFDVIFVFTVESE